MCLLMNNLIQSTTAVSCDVYNITLIQEQQDVEHNLKIIDQPSSKAMSGISKASSIRFLALIVMSAAALLIFITTGWVFYFHPHQNHIIGSSITKDLQSATTDLANSIDPTVISTSTSVSIPSAERQALQDPHDLRPPFWSHKSIDHYHHPHHHRQLIVKFITKDLQLTTTADLSTSVGQTVISTSSVNIPSTERQALHDLYDSTDGAHWNYDSSSGGTHWSFDDPDVNPCAEGWYGIRCSADYHIIGLSLAGSNLIGTIPESLSQLTLLRHLNVGGNLLIEKVPTTLCQIKSFVQEGNSVACFPHCLEHAAVEVEVHPSTPVCNNIPSPSSLSNPSKDVSSSSSSLVMTSSYSNNISPEERQALHDLYDSTDGPNWYNYGTRWDFSNPNANPCDEHWYRVTCSVDFHIIGLYLYSSNLRGTIPETIGQLSSLQDLWLFGNHLTSIIPSAMGQLSSILSLLLNSNQLIGSIPETICQLSSLQSLWLYSNHLTGTIPHSIYQVSSLRQLISVPSSNQLIGSIPATICKLISLQALWLTNNQLTGTIPRSINQLSSLQQLLLSGNRLIGSIPAIIGQLSSLQALVLDYNQRNYSIDYRSVIFSSESISR
jgi:Leucine-rich repeat (LRR) protein